MNIAHELEVSGHVVVGAGLDASQRERLLANAFDGNGPGRRCLLDRSEVAATAGHLRNHLLRLGLLPSSAVAVQAIAFDKTAETNWKVAWHQDLMFPFAERATSPGFDAACLKDGAHYARPPRAVLEGLLAVRLHLDDCGKDNGPLRVSPGTHRLGVLPTSAVAELVARHGEKTCIVMRNDCLLMRPLLLHASSQAIKPDHRRILHFVFHSGEPITESWAQAI
jgi:ectoine hydroxylase-related dioxygenase (phytanoyl-CoA dioxygenase family)